MERRFLLSHDSNFHIIFKFEAEITAMTFIISHLAYIPIRRTALEITQLSYYYWVIRKRRTQYVFKDQKVPFPSRYFGADRYCGFCLLHFQS